jgi:hypothetical protein
MKNHSVFIILMIIINASIAAQSIPTKDLQIIKLYGIGDEAVELGYSPENSADASRGIAPILSFSKEGRVLYDVVNERLFSLSPDFELREARLIENQLYLRPHFAIDDPDTLILELSIQLIRIIKDEFDITISLKDFPEFRNYRSFAYYDDVLFVHDAELNLWSIPEPVIDQDENRAKLLNERQTREYVNERWGATGEVQVDGEGRLFIDGQLVTRDYQQFWQYMEEAHGPVSLGGEIADSGIPVRISYNTKPYFLGRDLNGNWYWNDSGGILVHSPDGSLINVFITELGTLPIRPAIDQLGNVYILDRSDTDEVFNLYRIPNDWSPIDASLQSESEISREVSQNLHATVINSRLRVRSTPSLDGEMLGMLEIGEEVRVLEKSDQQLNIGELTDFWYRIDNGNGLVGWAYGGFLRMEGQ